MRVLQIDDKTLQDVGKLIKHAEKNIITASQLKLMIAGDLPPIGDNPDYFMHIHDGYRVVFSIEEQSIGLCNHISVSIDEKNKPPNYYAAKEILKLFNMSLEKRHKPYVWEEKIDKIIAMNILQKRIPK